MKQNQIYRAISSKYIPATNYKGARISATDGQGNRVIIPYDDSKSTEDAHIRAINTLTDKMEWSRCVMFGATKNGLVGVMGD